MMERRRVIPEGTARSIEIVPRGGTPLKIQPQKGGPPLEFINIQPLKRGSASTIHQHTAPQKGVRLYNSSTKGGRPLDFIN